MSRKKRPENCKISRILEEILSSVGTEVINIRYIAQHIRSMTLIEPSITFVTSSHLYNGATDSEVGI